MSTKKNNIVIKAYQDLPPVVRSVLVIGTAILVAIAGWSLYKKISETMRLNKLLKQQQNSTVATPSGTPINLSSVASEIYDSFFNNDWLGWTEDEGRAMEALKTVPKQYIPQLEILYSDLYKKNLKNDMVKYLAPDSWDSIKYLFNS